MNIFDSHCHPQMAQYDKDREEMLARAKSAGVSMICVGTDLETSKQGIELAQRHDNMWASVGIHPNDITMGTMVDTMVPMVIEMLKNPKVVAIGEVGLDYYRTPEPEKQKKQKQVLEQFLNLAVKYNKPIVIHCRDSAKGTTGKAHKEMIEILSRLYPIHDRGINTTSENKYFGVMHSFTGTKEQAEKYLEMGFCLGFNGILTFTHQYDEVVKYVSLENILLETDAPFLAPEPYRSKRNEPAYIIEVAKKIAELKKESSEKIIEQTALNCQKLFNIAL